MLQTIREHTQGWIAGTIITIIILTFALWGVHSYFVGGGNSTIVAKVNDVDITKEQLAVAYERLRRQVQIQYGSSNPALAKNEGALKARALQSLIDVEVLRQASLAHGFRISDRQIDNYLQSMPEFQVDGQFSMDKFEEILSSTLLTTGEFLELIRTSLLIDQPKLGVIFTSFALRDETNYTIALVNQEREVDYITIPLSYVMTQPIVISPASIQAYYDEHRNDFMTPEQVNVDYIELSLKDLSSKITPTDAVLKSFYNENINAYTKSKEWKLADIEIPVEPNASAEEIAKAQGKAQTLLTSINNGQADFSKLAKDNPGTQGLSPGVWVTLNQVSPELQKEAALLTKPGQVSEVIRLGTGFAILKALDIKAPMIQPFDMVKDKVKETYVHQRAEEKFAELREQLANITYEHPDSLQLAGKTLSLPIKTSELFTKEKGGTDISQYKKVRDTAFSNDVLNVQNNSDVIQLDTGTVIVLRVKSHVASTLLQLKAISKQIEDKLKTQEAEARAAKFAKNLAVKLQTSADPVQVANENKLKWNTSGFIGRYSTKLDSAILDLAFRLPDPAVVKVNRVYGVTRLPNGYAVVAVKSVKAGSVPDKKQYTIFAEQVQNSEGLLEYELYKQSQTKRAKIRVMS